MIIQSLPFPLAVASDWTLSSANIVKTPEADGFYKLDKTGGANGNYTDARAWTNESYSGDFTFIMKRGGSDGETLTGVTDDPAYTYQTHDRGFYSNGSTFDTYDLGFTNITRYGTHVANDYLVMQRVGGTLSHYHTTDLNNLGTPFKVISDGATFNGAVVLERLNRFISVKMIAGTL